MNLKIKFRESFRPFAPAVLAEQAREYFDLRPGTPSPYMLLVASVREDKRTRNGSRPNSTLGIDKLKEVRSVVPAITHVDYSARVQTVDEQRHGRFYQLLKRFEQMTGTPLIINTSFNIRGEPIVCSPQDAFRCFLSTDMDALVLERFVLLKERQNMQQWHQDRAAYLATFSLD